METFVAIFPHPTNHPWVSEDEEQLGKLINDAVPEETKRHLAPVVQTLDSAIHRINHYPADSVIGFPNTYPLDSDLSGG